MPSYWFDCEKPSQYCNLHEDECNSHPKSTTTTESQDELPFYIGWVDAAVDPVGPPPSWMTTSADAVSDAAIIIGNGMNPYNWWVMAAEK